MFCLFLANVCRSQNDAPLHAHFRFFLHGRLPGQGVGGGEGDKAEGMKSEKKRKEKIPLWV